MILALFSNEWRSIVRDGRGRLVITLGVLLALVSAWTSASTHASQERAQASAVESARCAWEEREVDSAHSRAHTLRAHTREHKNTRTRAHSIAHQRTHVSMCTSTHAPT